MQLLIGFIVGAIVCIVLKTGEIKIKITRAVEYIPIDENDAAGNDEDDDEVIKNIQDMGAAIIEEFESGGAKNA